MSATLIISVMADDKPGLVETLARIVNDNHGNWLASQMAQMAGKFAGILQVAVSAEHSATLTAALEALNKQGWKVIVDNSQVASSIKTQDYRLSVVGNDRPGIVREVSQTLAKNGVNVLKLNTDCESAAMSAEALFKAEILMRMPADFDVDDLASQLENLSNDMMVDIKFGR